MNHSFSQALTAGGERVAAWADLLDEINVFPVADGDTGRNLKISLAPFGHSNLGPSNFSRVLIQSATGNSGNIAAAFFSRFLSELECGGMSRSVSAGRDAARNAVANPKAGTMLTVFDVLAQSTVGWPNSPAGNDIDVIVQRLDGAVRGTINTLPELKRAGVVDAGALGMFIFFEGFFHRLIDPSPELQPITSRFDGLLQVTGNTDYSDFPGYCVNTVIASPAETDFSSVAAELGDSVVTVSEGNRLRLHLHTQNQQETRAKLETLGNIVDWQVEAMASGEQTPLASIDSPGIHVMTDAAGSLTRSDARQLGVTLLDSYLIVDDRRIPETLFDAQQLYRAMAGGRRVTTAQASTFQKYQSYESALGRCDLVLYLTVGSAYTGNFSTASQWRENSGTEDRMMVIDTGAASGRLGLIVRMVARFARSEKTLAAVSIFARQAISGCGELVFLDQLKFLAAGGRISKSKGFFGDLFGIKPIISPAADGAAKVGTVRRKADQVPFALEYLKKRFSISAPLTFLLQFSDNERRVRESILPEIQLQFPNARIEVSRLSLTSGAHMGPGTWGVAFCPDLEQKVLK